MEYICFKCLSSRHKNACTFHCVVWPCFICNFLLHFLIIYPVSYIWCGLTIRVLVFPFLTYPYRVLWNSLISVLLRNWLRLMLTHILLLVRHIGWLQRYLIIYLEVCKILFIFFIFLFLFSFWCFYPVSIPFSIVRSKFDHYGLNYHS